MSTELRAFSNLHLSRLLVLRGNDSPVGWTAFGPNTLILDGTGTLKFSDKILFLLVLILLNTCWDFSKSKGKDSRMKSFLKHFTAYKVETKRLSFDGKLSVCDLCDSHLRQYDVGTKQGKASGVMSPTHLSMESQLVRTHVSRMKSWARSVCSCLQWLRCCFKCEGTSSEHFWWPRNNRCNYIDEQKCYWSSIEHLVYWRLGDGFEWRPSVENDKML